jgi:hypothetical protein
MDFTPPLPLDADEEQQHVHDGDLGLQERGGEDPGDGTGEVLLDTGASGLPFDVCHMNKTYGPSQRGATAPRQYKAGQVIFRETPAVWVASAVDPLPGDAPPWEQDAEKDYGRFFQGMGRIAHGKEGSAIPAYHVAPAELAPPVFPAGGLHVAITGLMIRDREEVADTISGDSEWALHGSLDLHNFPPPQDCYEVAKTLYFADKADRWDVKRFGKLYGVVQVNALGGTLPFSAEYFGAGLFTGAAFFNHSCQPNAIIMVMPNSLRLQALVDIEVGEEITVAYQELPLEFLSPNCVRMLHMRSGAIVNNLGCRCKSCLAFLEEEDEVIKETGRDPDTTPRDVDMDLKSMWLEATAERLKMDRQLRTFVTVMLNAPNSEEGTVASQELRLQYLRFLAPPSLEEQHKELLRQQEEASRQDGDSDRPPPDFCPDLAYMMADMYCRRTIHYPGQQEDNLLFWTALYDDLLRRTVISMPKTLTDCLAARCYAVLLICSRLERGDKERRRVVYNEFMMAWIMLRAAHNAIFHHRAYLAIICAAYPNIGHVVNGNRDLIERMEMEMAFKQAEEMAAHQAAVAKEEEAKRLAQDQAALQVGPPQFVDDADDMLLPPDTMLRLDEFDRALGRQVRQGAGSHADATPLAPAWLIDDDTLMQNALASAPLVDDEPREIYVHNDEGEGYSGLSGVVADATPSSLSDGAQ